MKTFGKINIIILAVVLMMPFLSKAQTEELKVRVMMPENEMINESLLSSLQDRLYEAVDLNATGSFDESSRYVLYPTVNVVSKYATQSIPQQFVAEIEIALYFIDNQTKTVLSQTVIVKKGNAESENKAVAKALKMLQARDKKIKRLFDEGKISMNNVKPAQDNNDTGSNAKNDFNWVFEN